MSILQTIQTGRTPRPPRVLCYGTEGIGKSTFGAQAPNAVFIQIEDGIDEIDAAKFPRAEAFSGVINQLSALTKEEHNYETVVIDSLDWLERLIFDAVCREHGAKNIDSIGYAKGYSFAIDYWREFLEHLDMLRASRSMIVVLIAHAKIEKVEEPDGSTYDRYAPRLHKNAAPLITEWCDAVLFASRRVRIDKVGEGFRKRSVAKPLGPAGGERILRTTGGPACVAKNRYGIDCDLPLSWVALENAIAQSYISEDK